ncbi:hypothetical protein T4D_14005 [Trichinella pseudospiralis]|uniref:Uncharacterized protein n=1 Tax=Trichinella pseudospiralis TaxID=6337 RepID=A0A0V1FFA6_TRIPS|nr:hypothetical protein T4D_14005 [Trichinella pseudospiralis]
MSSYLMLCYGYTHVFSYNSINKRSKNSHDMKLNTSYPLDQNEAESKLLEIQIMHHTNVDTTGTICRNLQTNHLPFLTHTNLIAHKGKYS